MGDDAIAGAVRAFHFLPKDFRSDEDMIAGDNRPWRIGETRTYSPVRIDAGEGEVIEQLGYNSSPTMWDAFLQADGPVACVVEVSRPFKFVDNDPGRGQLSVARRLMAARDVSAELRRFACECAERVARFFDAQFPADDRIRRALDVARAYANGRADLETLNRAFTASREAAFSCERTPRVAAMSAWGATMDRAEEAAMTASRCAAWAVGHGTIDPSGATERQWQRERFSVIVPEPAA